MDIVKGLHRYNSFKKKQRNKWINDLFAEILQKFASTIPTRTNSLKQKIFLITNAEQKLRGKKTMIGNQ